MQNQFLSLKQCKKSGLKKNQCGAGKAVDIDKIEPKILLENLFPLFTISTL